MWDEKKQACFKALRAVERQGRLTASEQAALGLLTQELDALEAAYLHPATERVRQEREALAAQNTQLEELLRERQAYLAELRRVVAELEAREQRWRDRFVEITGRAWAAEKAEVPG
jgi:hypothetical protein